MGFVQAVQSGFRRYVDFQGRSSRSEYWYWVLMVFVVAIVLGVIRGVVLQSAPGVAQAIYLVTLLFQLAILVPSIALVVRRLHDGNRSGWWYFIVLTIIGLFVLLFWFCMRGTVGANKYGEDPLGG